MDHISNMRENNTSWKYTRIITDFGTKKYEGATQDGDGNEIKVYSHEDFEFKSIRELVNENHAEKQIYSQYFETA